MHQHPLLPPPLAKAVQQLAPCLTQRLILCLPSLLTKVVVVAVSTAPPKPGLGWEGPGAQATCLQPAG